MWIFFGQPHSYWETCYPTCSHFLDVSQKMSTLNSFELSSLRLRRGKKTVLSLVYEEVTRCQFHQHFYVRIFRTNAVLAAFLCTYICKKAAKMTFVRTTRAFNVDEIDGRRNRCKYMSKADRQIDKLMPPKHTELRQVTDHKKWNYTSVDLRKKLSTIDVCKKQFKNRCISTNL